MRIYKDRILKHACYGEVLGIAFTLKNRLIAFFSSCASVQIRKYPSFKFVKAIVREKKRFSKAFKEEEKKFIEKNKAGFGIRGTYHPITIQPKLTPCILSFNKEGTLLGIGYKNGDFVVYNTSTFELIVEKNLKAELIALDFLPGNTLFVGTLAGNFGWYNMRTWKFRQTIKFRLMLPRMAECSLKHKRLYVIDHKRHLKGFSLTTKELLFDIKASNSVVTDFVLNENFHSLIVAGKDQKIRIYDMTSGELKSVLKSHKDEVSSLTLLNSGYHLISSGEDNTMKLWDLQKKRVIREIRNTLGAFVVLGQQHIVAMGDVEGNVKTWKVY